jgi:hypothetical protein
LGGAKPRCAHLDVDISKILPGSRSALFSADGDASTIKRSEEVGVYYAGDNWVLVKKVPAGPAEGLSFRFISWLRSLRNAPTAEAPTAELKDSATYEIDRDAINAII